MLDPGAQHDQPRAADRARSEHAADLARRCCSRRRTGASEVDLDEQEQRPQPDVRRARAACGSRRRCGRPTIPTFCKAGLERIRRRSCSRSQRSGRHLAMYDPKTKKLTHISTCFSTHHLMFAEDANNTLWTSGGGPVVGWLEHEDVRRDAATRRSRRAGRRSSSTRTATASATTTSSRTSRSIPTKDKRINAGFYAVAPAPDGSIWGSSLGFPGAVVRLSPGANPPETALAEVLRAAVQQPEGAGPGLLAARHGRRSQRRRVGRARERAHGELRSPQVQGAAQRPDGDRPALPRGLDALPRAAAAAEGRDRVGQRRGELLHVGRSVRHVRARREHADQHRQRVGRRCSR